MSITGAMYTGVSGLLNNGEAMNVIGNNISNVNTVGFKYGRTIFSDMLSANIGNDSQVGRGVQMQKVENVFTSTSFETTENVTDLGIQGNSFFALKPPTTASPVTAQNTALLSRAGDFHVDQNLTMVNPDGYQVLDTQGNPIKFSDNAAAIAASATAYNAGATVAPAVAAITADIATAQAAVTAMPAGAAQTAAQALVTAATNANTAATNANTAFAASPSATTAQAANTALALSYAALQAAASAAGGTSTAGSATAVNTDSTAYANVTTETGKAFAKVVKVEPNGLISYLGQDGITTMYYNTSGAVGIPTTPANALSVQKLAVVTATDVTGLEKTGGSLYKATGSSGVSAAAFSLASNQPNGTSEKILSNSLEQSNVDMASQFVKMITTQRAYSANSKTITTADEMTQDILNLKR